jgi:cytochrome c oxidase subunit 2
VTTALIALLQVQIPGTAEHRTTNIFEPLATPANAEKNIGHLGLLITAAIFVVVASLIVYTMWRFRQKPGDNDLEEPPQVYGSNEIEAAWTVIPILIVFVLMGVTARVIASVQDASPPRKALHLDVIGHQWWWEIRYPDYGIVTANEIHVPATPDGRRATYMRLMSADVIHSFWVPQLAGKTDLVPNRINYMWMDPKEPGVFIGNCAEYCGLQHAHMYLRVVAETPEEFDRWAAAQQKEIAMNPKSRQGLMAFYASGCIACHVVRKTPASKRLAPDLTHLMTRQTLAAGVLANTPADLRRWVSDPQGIKPGCLMPNMKLNAQQLDRVTAFLQTLE